MKFRYLVLTALIALSLAATASASAIGSLNLANCAGGGVSLSATSIDWQQPVGTDGCIQTGGGTNVSYTGGGPLTSGVQGLILDLSLPIGPVVNNFMTFATDPNLHFDLTELGPGSANTICASALNAALPSCSIDASSPFILVPTRTGTTVILSASGIVRDGSGVDSAWLGDYTMQFAGWTPSAIQTALLGGGSIVTTYSGGFDITISQVPEPSSVAMVCGLIGIVAFMKRQKLGLLAKAE
jgi:hypothetical protein